MNAPSRSTRFDAGLAALRTIVGIVFLAHGAQKLFVFGIDGLTGAFASMGVPLAGLVAPAVALLELLGGAALVLGLFTQAVSIALAVVMFGALILVHLPAGFFMPDGLEFVLTLLAASGALALMGPGAFSLDAVRARRRGSA